MGPHDSIAASIWASLLPWNLLRIREALHGRDLYLASALLNHSGNDRARFSRTGRPLLHRMEMLENTYKG